MSFKSVMEQIGKTAVIALDVAGQFSPLLSGAITLITKVTNQETGEVEYTVVVRAGKDELDKSASDFKSTLEKINAERNNAGLPALDIPDFDTAIPDGPAPTPQEASFAAGQKIPEGDDSDVSRGDLDRG